MCVWGGGGLGNSALQWCVSEFLYLYRSYVMVRWGAVVHMLLARAMETNI